MSDFDPIEMKFGMQVKIDVLNNIPKFGCNKDNLSNTDLQFLCEKCFHSNAFEHQRAPP